MSEAKITIVAEDRASQSIERIGGAVSKLSGFLTAQAILGFAEKLISWAEEGDRAADVFEAMTYNLEGLQRATAHSVNALDLATIANRAHASGLQLNQQQLEAVIAAGTRYANTMGGDAKQATDQLLGALIRGREAGLLPFGIQASSTGEAVNDLVDQLDANRRAVESQAGALDRMKTRWEDLSTLFKTEVADAVNAVAEGLEGLGDAMRAAAREGADALTPLINRLREVVGLQRRAASGASGGPVIDPSSDRGRTQLTQMTRAGGGYSQLVGRGGTRLSVRTFAGQQRTVDLAESRLGRAGAVTDTGEILITAEADEGGGGGGGGRRQIRELEEARRLIAEVASGVTAIRGNWEEVDQAIAEARRTLGDFRDETLDTPLPPGANAGPSQRNAGRFAASGNAASRRDNADAFSSRSRSNAERAAAAGGNALANTTGEVERLGQMQTLVLGNMTNAVNAHIDAWMQGEQSIGRAIKGILAATLMGIATEATVKAIMATAEGFFIAATSMGTNPAAAAAFTAAAYYGAAAVAAGGTALAIGPSSVRSAAATPGRERSSTRDLGADRSLGGQGFAGPSVVINIAPGGIIGPDAAEVVGRLAVDGVNRGIRLGGMPRFDSSAIRTSGSRA